MSEDTTSPSAPQQRWFGHPRGLSTLFFTEMWERFSYYGMRAILILFMTAPVEVGGLGWGAAKAGPVYGLYTALVYLVALPGGWLADRVLGQQRSVLVGGLVIMCGHLSLALHGMAFFYLGLGLIIVGTGFLKPNISAIVGKMYADGDARRDAGFSIFYMGINIGAGAAPLVVPWLAQGQGFQSWMIAHGLDPRNSWHYGFGAAAVGMAFGVAQYVLGGKRLGDAGRRPTAMGDARQLARQKRTVVLAILGVLGFCAALMASGAIERSAKGASDGLQYILYVFPVVYFVSLFLQKGWTAEEKKRLGAIVAFFVFATLFWSGFEQAGSTLNLFAERNTRTELFGWHYPGAFLQSLNAVFIVFLAPVFATIWVRLSRRGREPSSPTKFAVGLLFVSLGYLVMLGASSAMGGDAAARVSVGWLTSLYLLHTIGELCLSPVGLSTMTKLAPARLTGQMLGVWFLASSIGNFMGGRVAGLFETLPAGQIFGAVAGVTGAFALVAFALVKPLRRLMGGVH